MVQVIQKIVGVIMKKNSVLLEIKSLENRPTKLSKEYWYNKQKESLYGR